MSFQPNTDIMSLNYIEDNLIIRAPAALERIEKKRYMLSFPLHPSNPSFSSIPHRNSPPPLSQPPSPIPGPPPLACVGAS